MLILMKGITTSNFQQGMHVLVSCSYHLEKWKNVFQNGVPLFFKSILHQPYMHC